MPNQTLNYLVDRTLTELNPNNSRIILIFFRILQIIREFFPNFFQNSFFLLSYRTEIFDPDNSESFPNQTRIIPELRIFDLTEPNPNNSFVTMRVQHVQFGPFELLKDFYIILKIKTYITNEKHTSPVFYDFTNFSNFMSNLR